MPNLSLRAYQQKIESWIEDNNIEKAISQSALILQQFPKNLRTFQILSKALLQKQDFPNAEKAFDVILQIEPDDFVSHIGKSMIAESNHSLDSAIEHMKHAFEIQPSNEGLQNELKRLMLAKDGIEPKKILLTRGALIKMYLKGKLYQQAIAECRIGISEAPQRIDYKIAMSKSFFESEDLIPAVETCVEIVSQLPYCLAANEILDKVLTKNHTLENNGFYHSRLIEIDPYYAFMLPTTQSIFDIPDITVVVDDMTGKDDFNYDLEPLFAIKWKSPNLLADRQPADNIDWDSIITRGLESPVDFGSSILTDESQDNNGDNPAAKNEKMVNSRKKVFLEKLRFSKPSSEVASEIPEWFFDENGEINQKEPESGSLSRNNFPIDDAGLENVTGPLETMPEENGTFDTDVQPAITGEDDLEQSRTMWLNDEDNSIQEPDFKSGNNLEDTQQIPVINEDVNELLINTAKALEGGNTIFAFTSLSKFVLEKKNISEVSRQLERAVELYPDRSDFRLLLGETYSILNEKEKALSILQNAQKFISL